MSYPDDNIPFLKSVAVQVLETAAYAPVTTCVIVPSRRAGIVFSEYLKTVAGIDAVMLPAVYTISDFAIEQSGYIIPDKDVLLLELFKVYQKHWPEEILFEEFVHWGRIMLSDFDEIDKYCVDAGKLFTVIKDEKEIEALFSIEDELREVLSYFWKIVKANKPYEKAFIKTWEVLSGVYREYKEVLDKQRLAYEGMAYRKFLYLLDQEILQLPFQQLHWVGFNAFSVVDERIISSLGMQYDVHMHWDVDNYYMDKADHEAGNFLRLYKTRFPGIRHYWNSGDWLSAGRKYFLHGASLHQGQVKVAADLLRNDFQGTTAVVLCEEGVLDSVLYEIPDPGAINLTMSLPVGQSALTDWLDVLYKINSSEKIHRNELERLAKHYYFRISAGEEHAVHFESWLKKNKSFYFSMDACRRLLGMLAFSGQGKQIDSLDALAQYWKKVLFFLKERAGGQGGNLSLIIPYLIKAINDKVLLLSKFADQLSFKATYQLLWSHLKGTAIPFVSDKAQPVQVMGFLETRLMDFDRVIILGANEDILPASKRGNSYIPYSLRKPFGLPTLQEYDGVYAYHFFRLLQRSKEAHFIYNNTPGEAPFEKSRFLEQILLELDTPENRIENRNWTYTLKEEIRKITPVVIQKTPEHIERLRNYQYSQSALTLYLKCPVQFYLRYVTDLKEPDTQEEIMNAGSFGNVLHKTIELLYSDLLGRVIDAADLSAKKAEIEARLKEAFALEYQEFTDLTGQNLLAHDVITRAVEKIIDADIQLVRHAPFEILYLEGKLMREITLRDGTSVTFQGKLDRVDKVGDHIRILDYKTGKVELMNTRKFTEENIPDIFERNNARMKPQTFQGLFYQLLINEENVQVGFYSMRTLSQGVAYLNDGEPVPQGIKDVFEQQLCALIEEILDINRPFVQNMDPEAYKYSPYRFIAPE